MSQQVGLEIGDGAAEGPLKIPAPIGRGLERREIPLHPIEALLPDEIVGHEKRELVGRDRPLAHVPREEAPRGAARLEVEAGL